MVCIVSEEKTSMMVRAFLFLSFPITLSWVKRGHKEGG